MNGFFAYVLVIIVCLLLAILTVLAQIRDAIQEAGVC